MGMIFLSVIAASLLMGICIGVLAASGVKTSEQDFVFMALAIGAVMAYLSYLLAGPYLQVRIGNMVWSATSFPWLSISSHLKAREYMTLQLVNSILTLLTLGLYRPFAVVRAYRYRIEHMTVTTGAGFEKALAGTDGNSGSASADGVADFLGVDLSW